MAQPRITFAVNKDHKGQPVEILVYLNPEGRDQFIHELQHLSERSDHFHMMPDELIAEVPIRAIPYVAGEIVPYHVKVMLRPDHWDKEHFPHVMEDGADA